MKLAKLKLQIRKLQARYYIHKLCYPFDRDWFKDKRVAIIGGADSVLKEKRGKFIDNYDVVVRINKGVEVIENQWEYVGTRTDILFHSFMDNPKEPGSSPITGELWKKQKVDRVIYSHNHKEIRRGIYDIILFAKKTNGHITFSEVPTDIHLQNIKSIAPYSPTTGHIAINTVLKCKPKEVYITGITFFKTAHNKLYRDKTLKVIENRMKGIHNPDAEYQYFKRLYIKNKDIIKPDTTLSEIIKNN